MESGMEDELKTENDEIIYHLKLSELSKMIAQNRRLIRITGRVDTSKAMTNESISLISTETNCNQIAANLLEIFQFDLQSHDEFKDSYQTLVDLTLVNTFDLNDINTMHDLLQFIGYKELDNGREECHFNAIYYRLIKRTNLEDYYHALNLKESYLSCKLLNID